MAGAERRREVGAGLLARLRDGADVAERIVVVAAHPDDEVIGAGGRLARLRDVRVVHVTDGAPADMRDARRLGFETRAAYAAAREREAVAALGLAGVGAGRLLRLGFGDREASLRMREVAGALLAAFRRLRPAAVLTHPFENGHPDHDATALAARLACRAMGDEAPALLEFASYHDADGSGAMAAGRFLPGTDAPEVAAELGEAERALKVRMMATHATQAELLRRFPPAPERYRLAPDYDYLAAPHPWRPLYEAWFGDAMTRERWRALAAEALDWRG